MRTIPYKREEGGIQACIRTQKKIFLDHKNSKLSFLCTKEAITLYHLLLCIEKRAKGKCVRLRAMGEERV